MQRSYVRAQLCSREWTHGETFSSDRKFHVEPPEMIYE